MNRLHERAAEEAANRIESKDESIQDLARNCFIEGAVWAVQSVWHKADEMPDRGTTVVIVTGKGAVTTWNAQDSGQMGAVFSEFNVAKWAYIGDLIPKTVKLTFKEN